MQAHGIPQGITQHYKIPSWQQTGHMVLDLPHRQARDESEVLPVHGGSGRPHDSHQRTNILSAGGSSKTRGRDGRRYAEGKKRRREREKHSRVASPTQCKCLCQQYFMLNAAVPAFHSLYNDTRREHKYPRHTQGLHTLFVQQHKLHAHMIDVVTSTSLSKLSILYSSITGNKAQNKPPTQYTHQMCKLETDELKIHLNSSSPC